MPVYLAVAAGGALGGISRRGLARTFRRHVPVTGSPETLALEAARVGFAVGQRGSTKAVAATV